MRVEGFRFFFHSNEGQPLEPLHIHVRKGERLAKVWLDPTVSLAGNWGFDSRELGRILRLSEEHRETMRKYWNEYFSA